MLFLSVLVYANTLSARLLSQLCNNPVSMHAHMLSQQISAITYRSTTCTDPPVFSCILKLWSICHGEYGRWSIHVRSQTGDHRHSLSLMCGRLRLVDESQQSAGGCWCGDTKLTKLERLRQTILVVLAHWSLPQEWRLPLRLLVGGKTVNSVEHLPMLIG